jgi:hypothetical protein
MLFYFKFEIIYFLYLTVAFSLKLCFIEKLERVK